MSVSERAKDQFVDGGSPGIGKAIVLGAAIGITVTFLGVGGACLAAGYEWTTAVGLGIFASIWSGFGFGFMFGGIFYVTRIDALQEAERKAARAQVLEDEKSMASTGSGSTTMA